MQGHRETVASLSDLFDLEHGSSSSNTTIDWSNLLDHHDPENLLPPSSGLRLRNDHLFDDRGYHLTNDSIFLVGQSSQSGSSQGNLDISSGSLSHGSEDSLLEESPNSFKPNVSNNQRIQFSNSSVLDPSADPSGSGGNHGEVDAGQYRGSLEGRCVPCKRKSFEGHVGQSSMVRSGSYDQDAENSLCPDASLSNDSAISGNLIISEQAEPNLQLGASRASSRSSERLSRSFRSRILHPSDSMVGSEHARPDLGLLLSDRSSSVDMNAQVQPPELNVPAFLPTGPHQASAAGPVSSRETVCSSSRNTLENHPIFLPSTDSRVLGQSTSLGDGSIRIPRNIAPSQTGASVTSHPPVPRRPIHFPRQLLEYVQMSLSAVDSEPGGGQSSYSSVASGPSASLQDMILSSRHGTADNHASHSLPLRSSSRLERQGDESVLGLPYSVRAFATAGEGRRRLASEVCVELYCAFC